MDYRISIITITYNAEKYLEQTIQSLVNQSYKNIEYIIIDGGSKDGTLDLIKKYEKYISYWVSEKDKGIYDAMNKGMRAVTGDIFCFLNADDYYTDVNAIQDMVSVFQKNPELEVVHGNAQWVFTNPDYTYLYTDALSKSNLIAGLHPPHMATFMRKEILQKVGEFDISYRSSGDFEYSCRMFKAGIKAMKVDRTIANIRPEGMSDNKSISWFETAKAIRQHFGNYSYYRFSLKVNVLYCIRQTVIKLHLWDVYKKMRQFYFNRK